VASVDGQWVHTDVSAQALAIMEGIICFHPFIDGNKRTAVVAADLYLHDRLFVWRWDDDSKFEFVVAMANGRRNIDELTGRVEKMALGIAFFCCECREIVLKAMIMKNLELLTKLDEYDRLGGDRDDARGADGDGG
jgi:fido (protein-threonine AMPylation protein)